MTDDAGDRRMLGALLRIPFQAIVRRIHTGLAAQGYDDLRPAHFVVFQVIDREGNRVTELAERAQMTKQSMGELVAHLEAHGYVERVADPADRRARIVRLSERGEALDRAARAILAGTEREWSERLGGERLAALEQTLRDLIDAIDQG